MSRRFLPLAFVALVLLLPTAAGIGGHYIPQTGDRFQYYETIVLNGGSGNYLGYTENTYVNGSLEVTGVPPNGTESASYQSSYRWMNSTGAEQPGSSSGAFTFSANSFLYVNGTDNQTGYTSPTYVWFYMNDSLAAGSSFSLLNTPFSVVSTDYTYALPGRGNVATISAQGSGSYERNDDYGVFAATYTWKSYFDPGTGYIVGYVYTEHDSDGAGDGFTWTDTLYVTSTTYALTSASATTASSPDPFSTIGVVIAIVFVVIILLVVVWLLTRRRPLRPQLPQHAAPGNIGYGAPPPPSYASMGGAPPIHLTPSQQPVPQVVLRETVKVKCRYCGTLIDVTDKVCPNCGAPLG